MKKRYYLAYGSNLNLAQMTVRCPDAEPIGTARLEGWQLAFKGSKTGSYLTVEKRLGSFVPVAVWATTAADEAALDRYEGCPAFYYKTSLTLPVKDLRSGKVKSLPCYIYIMHEDRPMGLPTEFYLQTCLEGYRAFGFDTDILMDALEESWRLCHENEN